MKHKGKVLGLLALTWTGADSLLHRVDPDIRTVGNVIGGPQEDFPSWYRPGILGGPHRLCVIKGGNTFEVAGTTIAFGLRYRITTEHLDLSYGSVSCRTPVVGGNDPLIDEDNHRFLDTGHRGIVIKHDNTCQYDSSHGIANSHSGFDQQFIETGYVPEPFARIGDLIGFAMDSTKGIYHNLKERKNNP